MRKNFMKKQWSFYLCIVLIVAMALSASGCNDSKSSEKGQAADTSAAKQQEETESQSESGEEQENEAGEEQEGEAGTDEEIKVLGEGEKEFAFAVVDKEGKETLFEIHTDKETVGEALQDTGLIEGEEGEYGLFVKTVNGITADYDKDGVYWAFYVNDEYAAEGVDSTKIKEGDTYAFKVE